MELNLPFGRKVFLQVHSIHALANKLLGFPSYLLPDKHFQLTADLFFSPGFAVRHRDLASSKRFRLPMCQDEKYNGQDRLIYRHPGLQLSLIHI